MKRLKLGIAIVVALSIAVFVYGAPCDSQVEYGRTTAYGGMTTLNPTLVANHAMTLTGLTANTLYHFRVRSRTAWGLERFCEFHLHDCRLSVHERGTSRAETSCQPGDVFRVAVENGAVRYYKNGAVIYQSRVAPAYPLVVAVALSSLNASVTNAAIATTRRAMTRR